MGSSHSSEALLLEPLPITDIPWKTHDNDSSPTMKVGQKKYGDDSLPTMKEGSVTATSFVPIHLHKLKRPDRIIRNKSVYSQQGLHNHNVSDSMVMNSTKKNQYLLKDS